LVNSKPLPFSKQNQQTIALHEALEFALFSDLPLTIAPLNDWNQRFTFRLQQVTAETVKVTLAGKINPVPFLSQQKLMAIINLESQAICFPTKLASLPNKDSSDPCFLFHIPVSGLHELAHEATKPSLQTKSESKQDTTLHKLFLSCPVQSGWHVKHFF